MRKYNRAARAARTLIGSLSMQRFWATDDNRKLRFAGQDISLCHIFKVIVSTSAKKLKNINVVVSRQVK